MSRVSVCLCLIIAAAALASCQPTGQAVIPTAFDLNAIATQDAATAAAHATANAPTATPTRSIPTLPPTFTPTIPPTATPPEAGALPSPTPPGFSAAGTIYYIFNGDSIAALAGDGSREELIAVGGPYTDLVASPDGELLLYVAPVGPAREVFVISRDGTYVQQVSCIGLAHVVHPTWSPDGQFVAFAAAPAPGAALNVYVAGVFGANNCPTGNQQRFVALVSNPNGGYPAWSADGSKLFYSDGPVHGIELATNTDYALTEPSGFGPDYALTHTPVGSWLAYLRANRDLETGQTGGQLFYFDTRNIRGAVLEQGGANYFAQELRWSADGEYLLVMTGNSILVFSPDSGSSLPLVAGTVFLPEAAFSPDSQQVAYVSAGSGDTTVPQVFTIDRTGGTPRQLTTHTEGTINSLNWLEG